MSASTLSSKPPPNRAIVFVDGSNFYHGLKAAGARNLGQLSYARIALKLAGPRQWTALHYVGQMTQQYSPSLYAGQRAFISLQKSLDARIEFHMGRLEPRRIPDGAAKELHEWLARCIDIDAQARNELLAIAMRHDSVMTMAEKAVDVMLAVDLVIMAERDAYDTAYVLSADGDYTHAVSFVRGKAKKVFAVSASNGSQLAQAVDKFIRIDADWVKDCYVGT